MDQIDRIIKTKIPYYYMDNFSRNKIKKINSILLSLIMVKSGVEVNFFTTGRNIDFKSTFEGY